MSWVLLTVAAAVVSGPAAAEPAARETSCVACHAELSRLANDEDRAVVARFAEDVHGEIGLSCHDCHGGDPAGGLYGTNFDSMHPDLPGRPFLGAPKPEEIAASCGRCHSDASYMKTYQPDPRTDQERLYWTSQHGMALRRGDPNTATCVDCHGAHGILRSKDPRSMVHAARVAETCNSCHGSPARMAGYFLANGRPMPVDQYDRWRTSVHAEALLERGVLSSPTCNDCHGDHGPLPAGVESIVLACGQCHLRESEQVRNSPLGEGFEKHRGFMEESVEDGCQACHEAPEPAAGLPADSLSGECIACHRSHSVVSPTVAMLTPPPEMLCGLCHGSSDMAGDPAVRLKVDTLRTRWIAEGGSRGLEGNDLYDWLLDRALSLPEHRHEAVAHAADELEPVPTFDVLLARMRIGKTRHAFRDPAKDTESSEAVVQCTTCHTKADGHEGAGPYAAAIVMRDRMVKLMNRNGDAAVLLLAARRSGVEVRHASGKLEEALTARAELGALLHTFLVGDGKPFAEKYAQGLEDADAAYRSGEAAVIEARRRGRWLTLSLALIGAAVVMLALKTRGEKNR